MGSLLHEGYSKAGESSEKGSAILCRCYYNLYASGTEILQELNDRETQATVNCATEQTLKMESQKPINALFRITELLTFIINALHEIFKQPSKNLQQVPD